MAKLAAIFTAMGLVDCAAEVFLTHRDSLSVLLDVDAVLDLLCQEAQKGRHTPLSYRDYMAAFERDDPMFYPTRSQAYSALNQVRVISFQARPLSLETMTRASEAAVSLEPSASGVAFRSTPDPWAYIGRMPLLAGCIQGGGWVAADVRVTHGTVGVGVLNRKGDDFLVRGSTAASDDIQTIFLRLDLFAAAGDLILQNWDEKSSSEGILQVVRIAAEDGWQSP